jgi:hypothetical protein
MAESDPKPSRVFFKGKELVEDVDYSVVDGKDGSDGTIHILVDLPSDETPESPHPLLRNCFTSLGCVVALCSCGLVQN